VNSPHLKKPKNATVHVVGYLPPISEEILIYFVAYCFRHINLQYSTIKLYLCGIHYKYVQSNVQSPFEKPDQSNLKKLDQSNLKKPDQSNLKKLALILKYAKRLQGALPRIRLPITFDILNGYVLDSFNFKTA
jgi:hypothetical protein